MGHDLHTLRAASPERTSTRLNDAVDCCVTVAFAPPVMVSLLLRAAIVPARGRAVGLSRADWTEASVLARHVLSGVESLDRFALFPTEGQIMSTHDS
jgi:hypothetical protein